MVRVTVTVRGWTTAGLLAFVLSGRASAQRRQPLEFTQQGVYVTNFRVAPGAVTTPAALRADLKIGRRAGDAVREYLIDVVDKRETKVITTLEVRDALKRAGYGEDTVFTVDELKQQGKYFRIDEMVIGNVTRHARGVRVDATLILFRDPRMRQPIASANGTDIDRAGKALAKNLEEARAQLKFQRRCENSLRDGFGQRAIQHAREGVAAFGRGALVRTCLMWALSATGAPATDVLAEAERVLQIDSVSPHAIEVAAIALDTLKRRPEAAAMWLRLVATDSTNVELIERAVFAMAEHGNARRAESLIVRASKANPANVRLLRQKWRVANDVRNWPLAVETGENLIAADPAARADSVFYLRLATAYRQNGQPFKSVEVVARGVASFPRDPRLYALYTQFIREEADTAIGRGIAMHPGSAELAALQAKDLRSKGKVAEALDASKRAVELDSTIAQGRLLVAQSEMELGRPDSALVTLQRAIAAREDTGAVASFALSKGNVLFRAANGTKTRADFQLAMRFLSLADSLRPTPQTKFLLGAAAMSVAQTALTDAPNLKVKEESCVLAHVGADAIPVARNSLEAGRDVSPDAVKQFLEYIDVISPFAEKQIAAFCAVATPAPPRWNSK
jgi:tetratricopeptide (TPR) repeat protein